MTLAQQVADLATQLETQPPESGVFVRADRVAATLRGMLAQPISSTVGAKSGQKVSALEKP